jgi:hypothetical protein
VTSAPDLERLAGLVTDYAVLTEASKVPLLDAMEAAGAGDAVGLLADDPDAGKRRLAGRLAELLPEKRHLAALELLAGDRDPGVAGAGLDALATQVRDAAWQATLVQLADSPRPDVADRARRLLAGAAR